MQEENQNENLEPKEEVNNAPKAVIELTDELIERLKKHQDIYYALVGGFLTMLISAIIWAVIKMESWKASRNIILLPGSFIPRDFVKMI